MRKSVLATMATALVGLVGGAVPAASAATSGTQTPTSGSSAAVCAKVRDCYLMGHRDVTGDGERDWIGAVNHHAGRAIDHGTVTLRVLTGDGELLSKRLTVRDWDGSVFHGIAAIDGRAGAEMVVGAKRVPHELEAFRGTRTSYSKAFHVVTFRDGRLVRSKAPDQQSRLWSLTGPDGTRSGRMGDSGAFSTTTGWDRRTVDGSVAMVREHVTCGGVAGCRKEHTTYEWRNGGWVETATDDKPGRVDGGWHVPGLPVW